ncbi:MAG: hypothetical protein V8R55_00540 [Dysosmobacter sp.]
MLGIVALVYAIPVVLFLVGYVVAFALGGGVGIQYLLRRWRDFRRNFLRDSL